MWNSIRRVGVTGLAWMMFGASPAASDEVDAPSIPVTHESEASGPSEARPSPFPFIRPPE